MALPSSPVRVLIVDCNVDAAEILGILLSAHGFETKVECGKAAALKTAQTFIPDAVLVDLGKDNLHTFELAAELRRMPELKNAYLVTLSDRAMPQDFYEKDIRFDARLVKPDGYRMLIGTLKRQFGIS